MYKAGVRVNNEQVTDQSNCSSLPVVKVIYIEEAQVNSIISIATSHTIFNPPISVPKGFRGLVKAIGNENCHHLLSALSKEMQVIVACFLFNYL